METYAHLIILLIKFIFYKLKDDHHFDILQIIENEKLDVYGRVKMINYIRKQNYNVHCFICGESGFGSIQALRKHLAENNHLSKGLPDRSVWHIEELVLGSFSLFFVCWLKNFSVIIICFTDLVQIFVMTHSRNLVPIFSNDHLLWMLESLLDERALSIEKSIETVNQDEFRMKLVRESEENTVLGVIISLCFWLSQVNLHFIDLIYSILNGVFYCLIKFIYVVKCLSKKLAGNCWRSTRFARQYFGRSRPLWVS